MFRLPKHNPDTHYAAVFDIGSATVSAAIVAHDPLSPTPVILWSYKERLPQSATSDTLICARNIAAATMNAFLELGSSGVKTLATERPGTSLTHCQVAAGAPWAYTVTKTVSSEGDQPFVVTQELIEDLVHQAETDALEFIGVNTVLNELGLEIINKETLGCTINGYLIKKLSGHKGSVVVISRLLEVVQKQLHDVITEAHEKVLPGTKLHINSFMAQFYRYLRQTQPALGDLSLIDVSAEATELSVIRDGIIMHTTHVTNGFNILARGLVETCNITEEEAVGVLRHQYRTYTADLPESQKKLFSAHESALTGVLDTFFVQTGEALALPKMLFLHADPYLEPVLKPYFLSAVQSATGIEPQIQETTNQITTAEAKPESRIFYTATVFHNQLINHR